MYVHANLFKVIADCITGRGGKAWETIEKLIPFNRTRAGAACEPFVMPNSYFGPSAGYRYGDAGSAWITGSAGWLVTAVTDYIFGLKPGMEGLRIKPCLPPHWKICSIKRFFRGATYKITYYQSGTGSSSHIDSIRIDGREYHTGLLPCEEGRHYDVKVFMT